jgi:hypothetical protein
MQFPSRISPGPLNPAIEFSLNDIIQVSQRGNPEITNISAMLDIYLEHRYLGAEAPGN